MLCFFLLTLKIFSACEVEEPFVANATTDYVEGTHYSHLVGIPVIAECADGHEWELGETIQTINCTIDSWANTTKPCVRGES